GAALPSAVTFVDNGNGTGTLGGTPAASSTAFLTQLTNTTGGSNGNEMPAINSAGTRIVFASDRDLTPGSPGNADGNEEIFLYDTTTGTLTQITNTTGTTGAHPANEWPAINSAGTRIAFRSNRNLTPGSPGNADGSQEIFLYDTGTTTFTQIT